MLGILEKSMSPAFMTALNISHVYVGFTREVQGANPTFAGSGSILSLFHFAHSTVLALKQATSMPDLRLFLA